MAVAPHGIPKIRDPGEFVQARAKLQRIRDMRFFNGWVKAFTSRVIRIQMRDARAIVMLGEKFSIEVAGKENTASMRGEVTEVNGVEITLGLSGIPRLLPKIENVRFWMYGNTCSITLDEAIFMARTIDISESGLSVLTLHPLPSGVSVDFDLQTGEGIVHGTGEVLYTRSDPRSPNQFRSGIKVNPLNRIQQARWDRLVHSIPDAG